MSNERFFRLLSVALLGLVAFAVVPNSHADDSQELVSIEALPIEVTIVREVDEINAGQFNPVLVGRSASEEADSTTLVPSPVKMTTLTFVDPNL